MTASCGTNDLNTDKGEVGGSSPPRPTIQIRPLRRHARPGGQTSQYKRVYREQCTNPEARERRIASNGGDVFQKESILFEVLFRGHRCG